jgi:hypothetical protein
LLPLRYPLPSFIRNAPVNRIIAIEPVSSQDATARHFCWDSGVPLHNASRIFKRIMQMFFIFPLFFLSAQKRNSVISARVKQIN